MADSKNITLKKAKIKDNLFLEVEYSEQAEDGTNTVKKDCSAPVHDDLKKAFKKLNIHLALLCEQVIEPSKGGISVTKGLEAENAILLDPDEDFAFTKDGWQLISKMACKGFTIGGSGDNEGVTLIGTRTLSNDKALNLVSPFTKWEEDYNPYSYSSELSQIIEECKHEVKEYLFNGKHQPDAQMSLEFEAESTEA